MRTRRRSGESCSGTAETVPVANRRRLRSLSGRPKVEYAPPPADDASGEVWVGWLTERRTALEDTFATAPADAEIWTWYPPDQTVGFAARRVANELAVHRYDAELARATPAPIDADRAASIIDELEVIVRQNGDLSTANGETIHLHGTDGGGEWMLQFDRDSFAMRREHAKGDLALRGTVSDLALFLYGRPTVGDVEQLGNPDVLGVWHQAWPWV